jgi:hypothetical protein
MRNSKRNIPSKSHRNLLTRLAVNALETYIQTKENSSQNLELTAFGQLIIIINILIHL